MLTLDSWVRTLVEDDPSDLMGSFEFVQSLSKIYGLKVPMARPVDRYWQEVCLEKSPKTRID